MNNFYTAMVNLWKEGLTATGQSHLIGCGKTPVPEIKPVKQSKWKAGKKPVINPTIENLKQEIKDKRKQYRKEGDRRRKAILSKEIDSLDKQWYKLMVAEKQQQTLF
jgi:hypothetical protein